MAKTKRRLRNRKTTKRKKRIGGFTEENKGNYYEYTFTTEEIQAAKEEDERLQKEWMQKKPTDQKLYYQWHETKPNLNQVVEKLFPNVKHKSSAVYNLRRAFFKNGTYQSSFI